MPRRGAVVRERLKGAFAVPRGRLGRVAGYFMARGNADMEAETAALLRLPDGARVLEVGCGPGVGVQALAATASVTLVVGVDPSEVMRDMAAARNREAAAAGRVHIEPGSADWIVRPDASFDAVLSVNNVMLWHPLDASARELRRVLRDGGQLALSVHVWALPEPREAFVANLEGVLGKAGFTDVRVECRKARSGQAVYLTASTRGRA